MTVVPTAETSARTTRVSVAAAPAAKLFVVADTPDGVTDSASAPAGCTVALRSVRPAGRLSVTTTLAAEPGPPLPTANVYVPVPPATISTGPLFNIETSAFRTTGAVAEGTESRGILLFSNSPV